MIDYDIVNSIIPTLFQDIGIVSTYLFLITSPVILFSIIVKIVKRVTVYEI